MLTLRKLLEMVADYDRRVEVAIETKHPTRYGGLVEKRVAELLHDFGWDVPGDDEPSPAAGDELQPRRAAADASGWRPAVRLVQLIDKASVLAAAAPDHGRGLAGRAGHLAAQGAPAAGASGSPTSGHGVHVWTVNTEPDLRRCQELGVQAVITDRPAYLLELLGK